MKTKFLLTLPFLLLAIGLALFAANVPIGDDYDAILNYLNRPWPDRFFHLADFHNEHRIVSTRLASELVYRTLGHIDFRVVIWIGNLGWWIFSGVFAWLFWRRDEKLRWGAVFAVWMLVGFYDLENAFWAMASIQNHGVIAFAFASCLAFSRRDNWKWFATSLAFAVAATFTSGGGLLVFPSLVLMSLCDSCFSREPLAQWRQTHFPTIGDISRQAKFQISIFAIIAAVTCALMLHNMPNASDDPTLFIPSDPVQRIKGIIGFFFCFFGNLIPSPWIALFAGLAIVVWGIVICLWAPRYRGISLAIFSFLAFLVANILAATLFRGGDASFALAGRYRLISAALIVSLLYLTLADIPFRSTTKIRILTTEIVVSMMLSCVYLIGNANYSFTNRRKIEVGISQWPATYDGLDYPTNKFGRGHASAVLMKSRDLGVYAPRCAKP